MSAAAAAVPSPRRRGASCEVPPFTPRKSGAWFALPEREFIALIDELDSAAAIRLLVKLAAELGGLGRARKWSEVRTLADWAAYCRLDSERQVQNVLDELAGRGAIAVSAVGRSYRIGLLSQNWTKLKEWSPPPRKPAGSTDTARSNGEQTENESRNTFRVGVAEVVELPPVVVDSRKAAREGQTVETGEMQVYFVASVEAGAHTPVELTRTVAYETATRLRITDHIRVLQMPAPAPAPAALIESESDDLYEQFRGMWAALGKPVSKYAEGDCRAEWDKYDVEEQRFILRDVELRYATKEAKYPPLKYLQGKWWRTDPCTERTAPLVSDAPPLSPRAQRQREASEHVLAYLKAKAAKGKKDGGA